MNIRRAIWATAVGLLLVSCSRVPITGRQRITLVPAANLLGASSQLYAEFLRENPPSGDLASAAAVRRVGTRIQQAVESHFATSGLSDRLRGYRWEFNLVDNQQVNAWCLPGGKVVVYSGILPFAAGENGLAVIMGHEIAHAIAEHGAERMSQNLLVQLGGVALDEVLTRRGDPRRDQFMLAFGLGSQLGLVLPFSRAHESEADRLGLIFMALAGYDPREAPAFWYRMSQRQGGQVEFLSTHPSNDTRTRQLRERLPEAMRHYRPASEDQASPRPLELRVDELMRQVRSGDVVQAMKTLREIDSSAPHTLTALHLNNFCWFATLRGHATMALPICERAVAAAPTDVNIIDSRGLARALTGDVIGAIADFERYTSSNEDARLRGQRRDWVNSLRRGSSPFTQQLLNQLLQESP